jgi:hypothetical protein
MRMRLTIPHEWKQTLLGDLPEVNEDIVIFNKLRRYKTLKTKDLYSIFIENDHDCESKSNTQIYQQTRYGISDDMLKKVYTLPYISTRSTTLQALQYKILHKIINCNYWLHKIRIKDSPQCRFCRDPETIDHFFYSCENTKHFWYAMLRWWNSTQEIELRELKEKDIMLGHLPGEVNKALNCCILIGKNMIYRSKNNNKQPDIYAFHVDQKNYLETERFIHTRDDKLEMFLDLWGDAANI